MFNLCINVMTVNEIMLSNVHFYTKQLRFNYIIRSHNMFVVWVFRGHVVVEDILNHN